MNYLWIVLAYGLVVFLFGLFADPVIKSRGGSTRRSGRGADSPPRPPLRDHKEKQQERTMTAPARRREAVLQQAVVKVHFRSGPHHGTRSGRG